MCYQENKYRIIKDYWIISGNTHDVNFIEIQALKI